MKIVESGKQASHAAAGSPVTSTPSISRKRIIRRWKWLAVPIVLLALFYVVVGYFGSGLLIGYNSRWHGMNRGPRNFGLQSETVSFQATDGVPLKAWWLPAEGTPRATVILAHGIDHTRQVMLGRAAFIVHGGYNALALDLRCHGESGGEFVSPGLVEKRDIRGAIQYVRSRGERGPIVLLGVSLGAEASLLTAADSKDVVAVVSDGAPSSGIDAFRNVKDYYARDPSRGFFERRLFSIASFPGLVRSIVVVYYLRTGVYLGSNFVSVLPVASRITCPVLLISGERDWIVPTENARKILAALPNSRNRLVTIPNAGHDTTFSNAPVQYKEAVLSFLDSNIAK
jgi:pimeloyl-ACP methyl ester carboxylesterase